MKPRIELAFAHLADYAAPGAGGKITVVGIFNTIEDRAKVVPIVFPQCYLVAEIRARLANGSDHRLTIDLVDADGKQEMVFFDQQIRLATSGPGSPLAAQIILQFGPGSMPLVVQRRGEYQVRFSVESNPIGEIPVYVREALGEN